MHPAGVCVPLSVDVALGVEIIGLLGILSECVQ
jgi:hypothetical protein